MKSEIIIGIVGGIGTNIKSLINELKLNLRSFNYDPIDIKISKLLMNVTGTTQEVGKDYKTISINKNKKDKIRKEIAKHIKSINNGSKYLDIMHAKINLGNLIRKTTKDNSILSCIAINEIFTNRPFKIDKENKSSGKAYIIDQLKTIEEYKVLRKVYGRSFILMAAYEDVEKRKNNLMIKSRKMNDYSNIEKEILDLIERDSNENIIHGQNVENLFPEAHVFVDVGNIDDLKIQIKRFINIIFDYPYHTPTKDETMMFLAKGLASRSADLGRQVGAVVADDEGNIIAVGCNDVPKYGGGQYWENDYPDLRDFRIGHDSNLQMLLNDIHLSFEQIHKYCECKKPILDEHNKFLKEFENNTRSKEFKNAILTNKKSEKQFYELEKLLKHTLIAKHLEYGRCIHAEEAAICDAARRGVSLKNAILYCTTYPCHLCAKHILGVGIKKVVYIDPYPKSRAKELFKHTIAITESEGTTGRLLFEPFKGIAPRRFFQTFLKRKENYRKTEDGTLPVWPKDDLAPTCFLKSRTPLSYVIREFIYIKRMKNLLKLKRKDVAQNIQDLTKDFERILKYYRDWHDEEMFE